MLNWLKISASLSFLLVCPGQIFGEGKLPPIEQRKIIGTWTSNVYPCTMSFEQVNSNTYIVTRCYDGSGGDTGSLVVKTEDGRYVEHNNNFGEYFIIDKKGNLECYDNNGHADTWKKAPALWPKTDNVPKPEFTETDKKRTKGLNCYTIGYRYGFGGVRSMNGLPINPEWDFAVPDRCKNKADFKKGLADGAKKAW